MYDCKIVVPYKFIQSLQSESYYNLYIMPTHHRTCNLCEAMCGITIEHDGKNIQSIRGDKDDPFSKGFICPKAVALQDIYTDPDRLKQPVKRTENGWEIISWEQAYEEVVDNILAIQKRYGYNALGTYLGNPNVHNFGSLMSGSTLLYLLKTRNRYTATSVDQLPHHVAGLKMFGHQFALPIPDIDHTDFFLIMGANPMASNGSLMTAAGMPRRMKGIQKRGGKIVVIDPRRTETAKKSDEHIFIRPGSDVLLLLAMVHTVFDENKVQLNHLEGLTKGLDALKDAVADFSPEKVEQDLGISAIKIRSLVGEFCAAKSAVCYGRMGLSVQAFGGLCQWLINCFNILTGNLDREGGAMFPLPALDFVGQSASKGRNGSFGRWKTRVRGLPETNGELPVAALAEEILTEGEGQIKAMFVMAGNPVLSTPNGQQMDKAFDGLEYMVAIDIYINETTKYANIILPPTTGLETPHYDMVFHALAVRNTAKYSPALFEKEETQRHDWEILNELTRRIQAANGEEFYSMTPEQKLDMGLQFGPYGQGKLGLSLDYLKANPHGIDLGALKPCFPKRLFTKDKLVQLADKDYIEDLKRVAKQFFSEKEERKDYPFMLISRRQLRSNNSWMHNSKRLVKGKPRCTMLLHPKDAAALNIEANTFVKVASRVGEIEIQVEISDEIMPSVVSIPHGWGHKRKGVKLSVASAHAGVSINDLTDDKLLDKLTGNAALSGVPVQIYS